MQTHGRCPGASGVRRGRPKQAMTVTMKKERAMKITMKRKRPMKSMKCTMKVKKVMGIIKMSLNKQNFKYLILRFFVVQKCFQSDTMCFFFNL